MLGRLFTLITERWLAILVVLKQSGILPGNSSAGGYLFVHVPQRTLTVPLILRLAVVKLPTERLSDGPWAILICS